MIDIRPSCPVCGTVMNDAALHQRFHDGLRELARMVYCPDMSPEDYGQLIREQWNRDHPEHQL